MADDNYIPDEEKALYVVTFTVKPALDAFVIMMFARLFKYLHKRKLRALNEHGVKFTKFNRLILNTIYALAFMRAIGSAYTFICGVASMTDLV